MIRSGYSFRLAVGHIDDVLSRIKEIGWTVAPICDFNSTFGYVKWTKAAQKKGLRPLYGVELAVVQRLGDKKPVVDRWRFMAIDDLAPLHKLIGLATANPGREPSITYQQALTAEGVFKISGERVLLNEVDQFGDLGGFAVEIPNFYVGLSPGLPKATFNEAKRLGFKFCALSDNYFPRAEDKEFYRVTLGQRAEARSYPQHILSDEEWSRSVEWFADDSTRRDALQNRNFILEHSVAELKKASLLIPEKPQTLRAMCIDGARKLGVDLSTNAYRDRLDRELALIAEKDFEDYFFIIADMMAWAKERMVCGPARGSSCGSLVCYLLGITAIDPLPFGLIFERFIDTTRTDLPDIDLDFDDQKRDLVFKYMENKYGLNRVARLGTVGFFKPRSALNQAGIALRVPRWQVERVLDGVIERSGGDSRALQQLEDTLTETEAGRELLASRPEVKIAGRMEGHPNNASQHAAGVIITQEPLINYVAIDQRTRSAMCDKKDAEELNLLKIDALGLTQLSVFARTMELLGLEGRSGWLEKLPLDDPAAFAVLNRGHFAGVFQFMGGALQSLTKQITVSDLEDIIAITALARPGPMASGGAMAWVKRKTGAEPITYPHESFEPYIKDSLGIVIYQEHILNIGRHIGDLSWEDVTQLRKAMSKSLGKEFFDQYGNRWKEGAKKKGVPEHTLDKVWDDMCAYGAWCLSGNTKLKNAYPNQHSKNEFTIKELFEAGGFNPAGGARKQRLFSLQEGTIKPSALIDVMYSGQRETWLIEVETGETIRSTMEHAFLTEAGFKKLKDLSVGDKVLLVGEKEPTDRKRKKGTGSGRHNWRAQELAGKPLYKRQVELLRRKFKRCQNCKKAPYEETHHINMDHQDHRLENLLPVCRCCHRNLHGASVPHSKGKKPRAVKIISISNPKLEDTYDIEMPYPHNNFVANEFIVHNSFNRSHAVAYGIVSYWCCWLKAHHPLEFAAATLDAEKDPMKQIALLRELAEEGIEYTPVDADHSTDRWAIAEGSDKSKRLVGPLTQIKGIGPATMREVLDARKAGKPLREALRKKLLNAKTEIDTLFPVRDAVKRLHPDLTASGIATTPTPVRRAQCGLRGEIVVIGVASKIAPKDENEAVNVAKRGGKRLSGPTQALNLFLRDDTDEIFAKVNRYDFERLGRQIVEKGRAGSAIWAIKGEVWGGFRGIGVTNVKFLGFLDD